MDERSSFNAAATDLADAAAACDRASRALRAANWHGNATDAKRLSVAITNLRATTLANWESGDGTAAVGNGT